ncbi:hypothetical protein BJ170DRAFT_599074 [Xylariales sp. AK1849]|nr:hypothetical protein BJ170DRAFT_599074 [Xylariales sp. AK1849]
MFGPLFVVNLGTNNHHRVERPPSRSLLSMCTSEPTYRDLPTTVFTKYQIHLRASCLLTVLLATWLLQVACKRPASGRFATFTMDIGELEHQFPTSSATQFESFTVGCLRDPGAKLRRTRVAAWYPNGNSSNGSSSTHPCAAHFAGGQPIAPLATSRQSRQGVEMMRRQCAFFSREDGDSHHASSPGAGVLLGAARHPKEGLRRSYKAACVRIFDATARSRVVCSAVIPRFYINFSDELLKKTSDFHPSQRWNDAIPRGRALLRRDLVLAKQDLYHGNGATWQVVNTN